MSSVQSASVQYVRIQSEPVHTSERKENQVRAFLSSLSNRLQVNVVPLHNCTTVLFLRTLFWQCIRVFMHVIAASVIQHTNMQSVYDYRKTKQVSMSTWVGNEAVHELIKENLLSQWDALKCLTQTLAWLVGYQMWNLFWFTCIMPIKKQDDLLVKKNILMFDVSPGFYELVM